MSRIFFQSRAFCRCTRLHTHRLHAMLPFAVLCKNKLVTQNNDFCNCQKYSVSIEKITDILNVGGKVRAPCGKVEDIILENSHAHTG